MAPWVRKFFIQQLPKKLFMRVPNQSEESIPAAVGGSGVQVRIFFI